MVDDSNKNNTTAEEPSSPDSPLENSVSDLEETSLLEEDESDLFWVIQRIIWGIVKTLIVLGGIIFLVWLIWSDSPITPKDEIPQLEMPPIEVSAPPAKGPLLEDPIKTNIPLQSSLETGASINPPNILQHSLVWLQKTQAVGNISFESLRSTTPFNRSQVLEKAFVESEFLLRQSPKIKERLEVEINYFSTLYQQKEAEASALENSIFQAIALFDYTQLSQLLESKLAVEKEKTIALQNSRIRQTLFKNILSFESLLRSKSIPLVPNTTLKNLQK